MARHQKEDHLAKGVYEGTNNSKRRENEKKRNEQGKEKPNGETSPTRGQTREPKKSPKEKAEPKEQARNPKGPSGKRQRTREETPGREKF